MQDKDVDGVLHVRAAIGFRNSVQDHVFESSVNVPRFACYCVVPPALLHEQKVGVVVV